MEKCIVYTDTLMELLKSLYGSVCVRVGCKRALIYHTTYVGTCLVVDWKCDSGHVMLVEDGQHNLLAATLEQEISWHLLCSCPETHTPKWG
jgi:hypothetical protein